MTNNLDETTYRADAWKTENTLTYDNTFNDMHTVGVLLSTTADHYSKRGLEVNGKEMTLNCDRNLTGNKRKVVLHFQGTGNSFDVFSLTQLE